MPRPQIALNPKGRGDWIAYSLADGIGKVRHRGSNAECVDAVLQSKGVALYVKYVGIEA